MRKLWRLLGAAGLAVPIMVMVGSVSASARVSPNGEFAIEPVSDPNALTGRSFFDESLVRGLPVTDEAVLSNLTNKTKSFLVYAADGYDTPKGGSFAVTQANQTPVLLGSWVKLQLPGDTSGVSQGTVTVPGDSSINIPFTITPPLDAPAGDYTGAIVAVDLSVTPAPATGKVHIGVQYQVGARIYGHVIGPRTPGIAVSGIQIVDDHPFFESLWAGNTAYVRFAVTDTGNTLFNTVTAHVKVINVFGQTVHRYPNATLNALIPGTENALVPGSGNTRSLEILEPYWKPKPWDIGPLTVHVTLDATGESPSEDATASGAQQFWVVPWLALIVIVLLVVGFFWWRHRRRRERRAGLHSQPPPRRPRTEPMPERIATG